MQRIIALSRQPRQSAGEGPIGDRSPALQTLGDLGHEASPLARPIAWSEAACRSAERRSRKFSAPGSLCAACPLAIDCSVALSAGAPTEVQQWRERVDGGRALAA
ncbi:hypothetical protein [Streptomyces sp. G-G2]|uniref:hypothetical protein n=1 Tax=Streptomyces sp. G-G2 TaxID=3046201 RepID=UPI0024BB0D6A|nr:hypothetical protein [Streptomyces sp. G-G2]MDJ0383250.1 hypothetical protein [Streptomyces sp. G-G2]